LAKALVGGIEKFPIFLGGTQPASKKNHVVSKRSASSFFIEMRLVACALVFLLSSVSAFKLGAARGRRVSFGLQAAKPVATKVLKKTAGNAPLKYKLIAAHVVPLVGLYLVVASGLLKPLWEAVRSAVTSLTKRTTTAGSVLAASFKKAQQQQQQQQQQQKPVSVPAAASTAAPSDADVAAAKAKVAAMVKEEERMAALKQQQQKKEADLALTMEKEAAALIAAAEASKPAPAAAVVVEEVVATPAPPTTSTADLQVAVDNGRDKMIIFLAALGAFVPLLQVMQQQ